MLVTSLTSERVQALLEGDALSRMLEHHRLTVPQFQTLYRKRGYEWGRKLRKAGRKISRMRLEPYAEGIQSIKQVVRAIEGQDRLVIIGRLLDLQPL